MDATSRLEVAAAVLVDVAIYLATGRPWAVLLATAAALLWFAHGWDWSREETLEPAQDITGGAVDVINLKGGGKAIIPNPGVQHRRGAQPKAAG